MLRFGVFEGGCFYEDEVQRKMFSKKLLFVALIEPRRTTLITRLLLR